MAVCQGRSLRWMVILLFAGFLGRFKGAAQPGGNAILTLLNLPPSARMAAMGGEFISALDNDPSLALFNPALLNPSMHHRFFGTFTNYLTGVRSGSAGFAHHQASWQTTMNWGLSYVDYGTFVYADELGNTYGSFSAQDVMCTWGAAQSYAERFRYGVNLTYAYSQLEHYDAHALAATLAGSYHDSARALTATVLFRHVGGVLNHYLEGMPEPLPFGIVAGVYHRLRHSPFALSLMLHNLHRWNLRWEEPKNSFLPIADSLSKSSSQWLQELLLHAIIGAEVYIGSFVRLSMGYHFQRRRQLAFVDFPKLSGFSFGVGITIRQIQMQYGRAIYNVAGATNTFTLGVDLHSLFQRKP